MKFLKIQIISIILLVKLYFSKEIEFCQTPSSDGNTCLQCANDFIKNTSSTKQSIQCTSNCLSFLYLKAGNQKCISSCDSNQIGDSLSKVCRDIYQCPILIEVGHDFHNGPATTIIIDTTNIDKIQQQLISISDVDDKIKIWDLTTGYLKQNFLGHTQPILKIYLQEDVNQLISFSSNGEIIFWDLLTGQIKDKQVITQGQFTTQSQIDTVQKRISLFGLQGEFFIYNYETQVSKKYIGHSNIVIKVFYYNFNYVITYSLDKLIILWNINNQILSFFTLCTHDTTPAGLVFLDFSVNMGKQFSFLLSFGSEGDDAKSINITDLISEIKKCEMRLTGDFTQNIINIIADYTSYSIIAFSQIEILIYSFNIQSLTFFLHQKINKDYFSLKLLTPIKGVYLNSVFIVLYTETGKVTLMNYQNNNAAQQQGQSQTVIQLEQIKLFQLSRNDIRGVLLDIKNSLLFIYGEQILQINLIDQKVNYVINNIIKPYINHKNKVTSIDKDSSKNIIASTSFDGLSMTYDYTSGKLIQIIFHPDYLQSTQQPQGIGANLIRGILICVAYNDKSVICYNAVSGQVIYKVYFFQNILKIFKDDINGYLLINSLDYLQVIDPFKKQVISTIQIQDQFFSTRLYSHLVLLSVSMKGSIINWNYPSLIPKKTIDLSQYNEENANIVGYSFENSDTGKTIYYYDNGLVILYDENLEFQKKYKGGSKPNFCGLDTQLDMIACYNDIGEITAFGIKRNYYHVFKLYSFPIIITKVINISKKCFVQVDMGSFGGQIVYQDGNTLTNEFQFLTSSPISFFLIDDQKKRLFISTDSGDIKVNHFNANTHYQLVRKDTTLLQQVYLIRSDQLLVVLSSTISIYNYFENIIYKTNTGHSQNQNIVGAYINEDYKIIISYNNDQKDNLQIWNYITDQNCMVVGHNKGVKGVQFTNQQNIIISYDKEGVIMIWKYNIDLVNVQLTLEIKQHYGRSILNLYIFNKYHTYFVSFDDGGNLFITNYVDGSITKAINSPLMKQMTLDFQYERIFLYGINIAVYSVVTGNKITDLLGFDGLVQQIYFRDNYIVAYGTFKIQSIQRDNLNLLFPGKFKKSIYQISLLKNLVGMIGFNVDGTIEVWDYTTGLMQSEIKIYFYFDKYFIGITSDEESELFIVLNSSNFILTVTPFSDSYNLFKDALIVQMSKSFIKQCIFDKVSNKLLVYNDDTIMVWNYHTYLGLQGQEFLIPSDSFKTSVYHPQKDEIIYADQEQNLWKIKNNILKYQKQLSYKPIQFHRYLDFYFVSDNQYLYFYDINFKELDKLRIQPFKIYVDERITFIFIQTYEYFIVQLEINITSLSLNIVYEYTNHENRIVDCIINLIYKHIITHDVTGKIAINNFNTHQNISFPNKHKQIVRDIQIDYVNKRLITSSEDNTCILYSYQENLITEKITLNFNSQVIQTLLDFQRNEVLIWCDLEQIIEVRDLDSDDLKLKRKIKTPSDYMIQMKLTVFSPFQVNLHNRLSNDSIINSLRMPSSLNDIIDIHFLSSQLLLVKSKSSLRIIRFSTSIIQTQKIFSMQLPYILSLEYDNSILMKIKGVNLEKVFNYTFPFSDDYSKQNYSVCYSNFQRTSSYFELKQDLELQNISFQKVQQKINQMVLNIEMDKLQDFFFVKLSSNQKINSDKSYVEQFYVFNKKHSLADEERIKLQITSFTDFDMNTLTLKNFEWSLLNSLQYSLNPATKNVILVNSVFKENISGTSLIFDNMKTFQVENLIINNLSIKLSQKQKIQKQNQDNNQNESISFIQISNSDYVYINKLTIENVIIENQFELINIFIVKNVYIQKLYIKNVTYFIDVDKNDSWSNLFSIKSCDNIVIQNVDIRDCRKFENCKLCQDQSTSSKYNSSNFSIFLMQANKQLTVDTFNAYNNENLMLFDISQQYLQDDLGYFKVINDTIIFNEINIQQSTSVKGFAFSQIQSDNFQLKQSKFDSITCLNSVGCAFDIKQTVFTISNCTFTKSVSLKGGAISIRDSPGLNYLKDSNFSYNEASTGGAIYLEGSNLLIKNIKIEQNTAEIGGGIRYVDLIPDFVIQQQHKLKNQFQNVIQGNKASIFAQNVGSYPRSMKIINKNFTLIKENEVGNTYQINNFMSGGTLNFQVELYDEEQGLLNLSQVQKLNQWLYDEISLYNIECVFSDQEILISGNKAIYDSHSFQFLFSEILLKAQPSSSQEFYVQNNMIKIPDSENNKIFKNIPQFIKIVAQLRSCKIGEVYVKRDFNTPSYCLKCPQQKYSLIIPDPDSQEDQNCQICPENAYSCEGNKIILKNGYWRENQLTDTIIHCNNNPSNCEDENPNSINTCKQGYKGPLCEQCDIEGNIWNQKYMNDGLYNCVPCSNSNSLILMYIFTILFGALYLIYGIRSALIRTEIKVQSYYLRMIGLASIGNSDSSDQSDIYLKFLMHFVQISSIVYQLELPKYFSTFQVSIGTPIDAIKYSQDCKSNFTSQYLPIVYGRIIWSQLIPLGYLILLLIIFTILRALKQVKINKYRIFTTGAIFMFLFFQPNIISGLVSTISCRNIGGKQYITADVNLKCYTEDYYYFNGILFLPLFLIWAVIIPLFWIISLIRKRKILNYCSVRLGYGFLYQEYKPKQYYWEFIKINLKILIVFVSTFFNQSILSQNILCTLILFGYLMLSLFKTPYMSISFNRCDQLMNIVLIICIQINVFISTSRDESMKLIGKLFLYAINYTFLSYLIIKVVEGKIKIVLNILSKRFPCFHNNFRSCLRLFGIFEKNKMRTYKNWSTGIKLIGAHIMNQEKVYQKYLGQQSNITSSNQNSLYKFYYKSKHRRKTSENLQMEWRKGEHDLNHKMSEYYDIHKQDITDIQKGDAEIFTPNEFKYMTSSQTDEVYEQETQGVNQKGSSHIGLTSYYFRSNSNELQLTQSYK